MIRDLLGYEIAPGVSLASLVDVERVAGMAMATLAALLILIAGFIISGWAARRIRRIGARIPDIDQTAVGFVANVARYGLVALAFLLALNAFGVQSTSIAAAIGAAGIAIGLALQGTLSNVAAGVMLVFFRPFRVGDFVEVGGRSGTVKEITINFTELATVANVKVLIPNAQVWGNTIVNYSAYPLRRAEWIFGVSYDADLKRAEAVIRETVMADPRSLSEPEPFIQVNNLGESSVDFLVRVWVNASDYFAYQADIKRKVKEALDAAGIEIPFPHRKVILERAES